MSWWEDASCREFDPSIWEPDDLPTAARNQVTRQAKAICATCPVAVACLQKAREEEGGTNERGRWGIRGGLTASERAALGPLPQPCVECGTEFIPYSSLTLTCSDVCRKARHVRQRNASAVRRANA